MKFTSTRPTDHNQTISSPTGGWNARDSLADMPPGDAVTMENWFPRTSDVMMRKGFSNWATGITGIVESLCAYNSPSFSKLFAIASGSIYDVSSAGAVGSAVVTGLSNSRSQYVNITTAGGSYMLLVNGQNKLRGYDGTSWWADGDGTHNITEIDTSLISNISVHMHRVWLVQRDTMSVWYLGTDSIAGSATQINLGGVFKRGGYLMAMGSWTIDAGSGMDDQAVFVTSRGECAVFKGYDPASSTTWALVGVYQLGSPIGRRCLAQYASDLIMISQDGLMPMSKALMTSRVNSQCSLTDKIQTAISEAVTIYGANFGWQAIGFPQANMLVLNIPISNATEQYAMNTISGAWCRFTGWKASCWELFNDQLYFGTTGAVCLAWDTQADNGSNISATCMQAFGKFGTENLKWFKEVRPIMLTSSSSVGVDIGMAVDYSLRPPPVSTPVFPDVSSAVFGSALFGSSVFGSDMVIRSDWQTAGGYGQAAAIYMKVVSRRSSTRWSATTYRYEIGSGI